MTSSFNLDIQKTVQNKPVGTYLDDGSKYYTFDVITKEEVSSRSNYTDHFCEDGSIVQDHVVFEPIRYTLTGMVAEKIHEYTSEPTSTQYVERARTQDILRKTQVFGQFVPELSSYIYSAINTGRFVANRITQLIKSVQSITGNTIVTDTVRKWYEELPYDITGIWGLNKTEFLSTLTVAEGQTINFSTTNQQQKAYSALSNLRKNCTLLTLHCPYGELKNVVIESIDMGQSKYMGVSDITVVVKQIRFVKIAQSKTKAVQKDDREQQMQAPPKAKSALSKNSKVLDSSLKEISNISKKADSFTDKILKKLNLTSLKVTDADMARVLGNK